MYKPRPQVPMGRKQMWPRMVARIQDPVAPTGLDTVDDGMREGPSEQLLGATEDVEDKLANGSFAENSESTTGLKER